MGGTYFRPVPVRILFYLQYQLRTVARVLRPSTIYYGVVQTRPRAYGCLRSPRTLAEPTGTGQGDAQGSANRVFGSFVSLRRDFNSLPTPKLT